MIIKYVNVSNSLINSSGLKIALGPLNEKPFVVAQYKNPESFHSLEQVVAYLYGLFQ